MFVLYAIPIGILVGFVAGGHLERLAGLRLRWVPLILVGLAAQVAMYTAPAADLVGSFGPVLYIGSTAAVLVAVLRNVRVPGVALIAVGAGCNLAAVVANGGWMPADASALASIGGLDAGYTNSIVVADPVLKPLTDLFALPPWLPFSNVFSLGDVLIGIGVAATIALAMRAPAPVEAASELERAVP
ncbi:MAG TPA: DUF5317 domain-containing protein [Candidatus Limnocylindrales bacterium]|nr:DUF5317 domain-containing protein [Candidatus Limnocylindrales bacterium]